MPFFFCDDGFYSSKELLAVPKRWRLEVAGAFVMAGCWSCHKLTDGFIPDEAMHMLGIRPKLVELLIDVCGLCERCPSGVQVLQWSKWQRTREDVVAYRKRDAEYKRKSRARQRKQAASEDADLSDTDSDGTPNGQSDTRQSSVRSESDLPIPIPVPIPIRTNSSQSLSSLNVGPPSDDDRRYGPAVEPSASRIVSAIIPNSIPSAVTTALRLKASELMLGDGVAADVLEEALRRWLQKTDAGPGLLPAIVADVVRSRAAGSEPTAYERKTAHNAEIFRRLAGDGPIRKELEG